MVVQAKLGRRRIRSRRSTRPQLRLTVRAEDTDRPLQAFEDCHMYAVTFSTGDGPTWLMVVRAFREPDGAWAVDPIGGGAGRGPNRSRP